MEQRKETYKFGSIDVYYSTTQPVTVKNKILEAATLIGLRPSQEDRLVLIPKFFVDEISFLCVFDGTVGHDASEFMMQNVTKQLCITEELNEIININNNFTSEEIAAKIRSALRTTFLNCDQALINMCTEKNLHYASSTGVVAFLWKNLLTVAHVGDSKACIARVKHGNLQPEWLTVDHKPNMPHELRRIEENGGSLAWLHGNKPYIRGGDFFRRQALGEHPKQLNYSRAFGGKDLKMFGLSADPDISHFEISEDDKLVLIGSDGLWDVVNPRVACEMALRAQREGRQATQEIAEYSIQQMPTCGVRDNVTVLALFLNT